MCLLIVKKSPSEAIDLAVLHNRDELLSRPFAAAEIRALPAGLKAIFGTDLTAGGTWLAADKDHYSVVLNIRVSPNLIKSEKSRGELPIAALTDKRIFETLSRKSHHYGPFTLISGDRTGQMTSFSSIGAFGKTESITKGFSISNNPLNAEWEKPKLALKALEDVPSTAAEVDDFIVKSLLILENQTKLGSAALPKTGYPESVEVGLSSNFVLLPGYQTVASTVLLFLKSGSLIFVEKNQVNKTVVRLELE
jgi:uncharacterized protein with NRDE domain